MRTCAVRVRFPIEVGLAGEGRRGPLTRSASGSEHQEAQLSEIVTTTTGRFTLHSEARGPHWIAWLTRDQESRPLRDVVLVGETREESESRARKWLEDAGAQGYV